MPLKVSEIIKLIEADGWYLAATRGSHRQDKHPTKPGARRAGRQPFGKNGGLKRENGVHGPTEQYHHPTAARRLRREDRRHRRRRGDARQLPRIRLLGDLRARAPRRQGRAEARAAPDPLPDERDGAAARSRSCQERTGGRRRDGPAAPARRQCDLRRARPDGAAVGDAPPADRRARQLRLAGRRRRPRGDALHGGADGARGHGNGRLRSTRTPSTSGRTTTARKPNRMSSRPPSRTCSSTVPRASRSGWPPTWRRTTSAR